jgi:hypothetical protein
MRPTGTRAEPQPDPHRTPFSTRAVVLAFAAAEAALIGWALLSGRIH